MPRKFGYPLDSVRDEQLAAYFARRFRTEAIKYRLIKSGFDSLKWNTIFGLVYLGLPFFVCSIMREFVSNWIVLMAGMLLYFGLPFLFLKVKRLREWTKKNNRKWNIYNRAIQIKKEHKQLLSLFKKNWPI